MNSLLLICALIGLIIGFPLMKLARRISDRRRDRTETLLSSALLWPLLMVLSYLLFQRYEDPVPILTVCAAVLVSMLILSFPVFQRQEKPIRSVLPASLLVCTMAAHVIASHANLEGFYATEAFSPNSAWSVTWHADEHDTSHDSTGSPLVGSDSQSLTSRTGGMPSWDTAIGKRYSPEGPKSSSMFLPLRQRSSAPIPLPTPERAPPREIGGEAVRFSGSSARPLQTDGSVERSITTDTESTGKSGARVLEAYTFDRHGFDRHGLERAGTTSTTDLTHSTSFDAHPLSGAGTDLTHPVENLRATRGR